MLLQRGHGRILSGFFGVFSCELLLVSLCSSSVLEVFNSVLSFSTEGVFVFSLVPEVSSDFDGSTTVAVGPLSWGLPSVALSSTMSLMSPSLSSSSAFSVLLSGARSAED
uniref:Secreted protein n=1 Tax=Rhizophora mucronata TaxID=61149 RepID=A0A2P2J007_RHIMU